MREQEIREQFQQETAQWAEQAHEMLKALYERNKVTYQIVRSENATPEEVSEATKIMIENQSYIKVPPNAEKIGIEEFYKNGKD